ncbi:ABC transporter substrate-binding protein [Methanohalophilus portucalensis]|uniref:Iron ABC transporter substrate-binding protein n=3 Tax=Methanohalophilus portucalensis TaxID=39664 RepID=A0A1L9C5C6_9EURY|nr:ABC transporter substrate-binding protein [Methanohalophilus portucalensis]ATU08287.1 iron ABC transporter substrate-binding protein [Methanohalophilus portucalensis]OJH49608.1 periplasmic binding protein [Methanohalophilus portucalensis FDF-1]RNI13547.1 iron ABC transporter substrate-binding protein [Methanohalophilus portucalensis FDF-1]SMH35150.1 iron complex transport system substrate-binding protein [Methanohalophilus portucalensis FDF-1]
MHKKFRYILLIFVILFALCTSACVDQEEVSAQSTRSITDMAGRTVTIPADVDKAVATSPPATMLIYMLAPQKLAGWNFMPQGSQTYLKPEYQTLPVIGGWFGKQDGNYETIISMGPDIIFEGYNSGGDVNSTINERQKKFGTIPVVGIESTIDAMEYEKSIKFMGDVLREEERAGQLISFYKGTLNNVTVKVSQIPEDERKRVYYAEGTNGLLTDPKGSPHSQLIEICGGVNVAECPIEQGYGKSAVSIEQVLQWDPEVIITGDRKFYENVYEDPLWQDITAIKNDEVYLFPDAPFCWFDRPPGVNRIIGIPWTAKVLYPQEFSDLDLRSHVKEFYSEFYHYELSEDEIDGLLNPTPTPK